MDDLHIDGSGRRVLAKVVRLSKVTKHPNADKLQIAEIGGWNVVVAPDENPGTLGVFFEIDSILPREAAWVQEALPKRVSSLPQIVVKSTRIRGCLSQGVFVKMKHLPLPCSTPADEERWLSHGDVTDLLAIAKRPDPDEIVSFASIPCQQRIDHSDVFPLGPCKTNEIRLQSSMDLLDDLAGLPFYITVKIDGCSATYGYDEKGNTLVACSRNLLVDLNNSLIGFVGKSYHLAQKLKEHPNLVIQAEVYGPQVNKNQLRSRTHRMAVFNVYDKERRKRLPFTEMVEACKTLDVPMVPVEETGESFSYSLQDLLEKAKGFYPGTKNHREGLVIRSQEQYGRRGFLSFKVINNDYLLQHGE